MTLIGACRDPLRVIRTEPDAQPEELELALDEVEILSGKLEEVWHDGWRGYATLVHENEQTVVHCKEFVADTAFTSTESHTSGHYQPVATEVSWPTQARI
jgi:hypothetical protein